MKLTTFMKLEESVIEDKDAVAETSMNDGDNTEKISPPKTIDDTAAVLEKWDSSLAAKTEPTVSPHTEN